MNAPVRPSTLATRIRSAAMFAPPVLFLIYIGGGAFTVMMAVAAGIGAHEWGRMVLSKDAPPKFLARLAAGFTALGAAAAGLVPNPVTALVFLLALCFLLFAYNLSQGGPRVRLLLAGMVYTGFSAGIMIWLRGGTSVHGLYYFATLLFIVWGSDIFAYILGRALGGPKLAPRISPGKTWAGFAGAALGAAGAAAGMACPALTQWLDVDTLGLMTWKGYAVMGAALGMLGQGGDLLVSAFKRHYGVKDTGALIPGHGGILDRIDALLLVAYAYGCIVMVAA